MKWWLTWLAMCVGAIGADVVTLAWDPSPSACVGAYRLYYGTNEGCYSASINAGLVLTQSVTVPSCGRWFFAVTAVCTNGLESPFSQSVQWEATPSAPTMQGEAWVRLVPVIERSTNLIHWTNVAGVPTWFRATNAQEFFTTRGLTIERVQRVEGQ